MADNRRDRDEHHGEPERRGLGSSSCGGTLDPGLKEQFERDKIVVRDHPSKTPEADALQRPHYEPEPDGERPAP